MKPKRLLAFDALNSALVRADEFQFQDLTAYAPLTEALWWIDYLHESFHAQDDGYRDLVESKDEGRILNGLRYARNRHTHNKHLKGMHWPDQGFDNETGRWRWRLLEDIPPDERNDRRGKADYAELMEGRDVFEAYVIAKDFLEGWYDSLDYKGDD